MVNQPGAQGLRMVLDVLSHSLQNGQPDDVGRQDQRIMLLKGEGCRRYQRMEVGVAHHLFRCLRTYKHFSLRRPVQIRFQVDRRKPLSRGLHISDIESNALSSRAPLAHQPLSWSKFFPESTLKGW